MKIKTKSLFVKAMLCFVLIFMMFGIYFATMQSDIAHALVSYEFETVPATALQVAAPNNARTIKPGECVQLSYNITPWYSTSAVIFKLIGDDEQAELTNDGLLAVLPTATIGADIKVVASANGIESEIYQFTVVKIPAESVTISALKLIVNEGESILISTNVLPVNASYKNIIYTIISGSEYGSIDSNGMLTINDNVQNAAATIAVKATATEDNIESNVLIFDVYTRTKSLFLSANLLTPVTGGSVSFTTTVSQYATVNAPEFIIVSGIEYVENFEDGILTVKTNVQTANAQIRLYASQDGIHSNEVTLQIYVLATSIAISASETQIIAGNSLPILSLINPAFASECDLNFIILSDESDLATFENGILSVGNGVCIPNAVITIKVSRDGIDSNVLTFTVFVPATEITLTADKTTAISSSDSGDCIILSAAAQGASNMPEIFVDLLNTTIDSSLYSLNENILSICSGIAIDGYIGIKATCDDAYATIRIFVQRVRVGQITILAPETLYENLQYQFDSPIILPYNAVIKSFEFKIIEGGGYASITPNGLLKINNNLNTPFGKIKVVAQSDGQTSNVAEIDLMVPVKTIAILSDVATLVSSATNGQTATFTPVFNKDLPSQPTDKTITYYIKSGIEYATLLNNKLTVKNGVASGVQLVVYATSGGITSADIIVTVYVPVQTLSITASAETVLSYSTKGDFVTFTPTFNSGLPQPTDKTIVYEITSGAEFATIAGDILTVSENQASGSIIKVRATSNGIISDEVSVTVNVPVENLNIASDKLQLNSYVNSVEIATFTPIFNSGLQTATNPDVTYYIRTGEVYGMLSNNILIINKNIAAAGKQICIYAKSGNIESNEIIIDILIPVESIKANNYAINDSSATPVNRSGIYGITAYYNANDIATDKGFILTSNSIGLTIINNNSIRIEKNVTADTLLSFTISSAANTNIKQTHYTKVNALNSASLSVTYNDLSADKTKPGGTDSDMCELLLIAPQLETGKYVEITPKYNNEFLSVWGLYFSVNATGATVTQYADYFRLSVDESASGKSVINYTISITDNIHTYLVTTNSSNSGYDGKPKPINIFKPLTNSAITMDNLSSNLNYVNLSPTFDAVYSENANNAEYSKVTNSNYYSLSYSGSLATLTITDWSVLPIITIKVTYRQQYNNTTIDFSKSFVVYIQCFDKQGGSGGTDYSIKVGGYDSIYVPEKSGYVFYGYYTQTDGRGDLIFNVNGENEDFSSSNSSHLYAYWLPLSQSITLLPWRAGGYYVKQWLFTCDYDGHKQIILDLNTLYELGYTTVSFSWTTSAANHKWTKDGFLGIGKSSGTAEPEVAIYYNANGSGNAGGYYYCPDTSWGTTWAEHTINFTASLSTVKDYPYIYAGYKDYGGDEHWYVAWSTITVTVS